MRYAGSRTVAALSARSYLPSEARMRLTIPLLSGAAIGLLAACSNPAPESRSDRDSRFEAELELAIFPESAIDQVVISDAEILRPAPAPQPTPTRRTPAPAPAVTEQPVPDVVPHVHPVQPAPAVPEVEATPVVLAGAGRAGTEAERAGRGSGVIIRGGIDERDPCVIHLPDGRTVIVGGTGVQGGATAVLGEIGVLINNPAPRDIGGGRFTGPSGSRGAIGLRGGGFAGGIR